MAPTPAGKTMTFEDFTKEKARKSTRTSKYATFITEMKSKTVYDATGAFPTVKNADTLRSALYAQAKHATPARKIQGIIRDGRLFIALAD